MSDPPASVQFRQFRHYLGAWDPAARVRVVSGSVDGAGGPTPSGALREASETELRELVGTQAGVAVYTVPGWVHRDLWAMDWDEAGANVGPRDQEQFVVYCRRVIEFMRRTEIPLGEQCEARLVACGGAAVSSGAVLASQSVFAVTNLGEAALEVVFRRGVDQRDVRDDSLAALVLEPKEGCVIPVAVAPYATVCTHGEYGLHLELRG